MPEATGSGLIPIVNRGVVDPAAAVFHRLGPLRSSREESFILPIDVPSQRFVEPNRHVVVKTVGRQKIEPFGFLVRIRGRVLHQGHSTAKSGKGVSESPTETERALRAQVVEPALVSIDVDTDAAWVDP